MSYLSLGFQALYMAHEYPAALKYSFNITDCRFWYKPARINRDRVADAVLPGWLRMYSAAAKIH